MGKFNKIKFDKAKLLDLAELAKGFSPGAYGLEPARTPFDPSPDPGCGACGGTGEIPSFRFSVPCDCVERHLGWVLPDRPRSHLYWNIKGEEVEVSYVTDASGGRGGQRPDAVCVGRLCHHSRPGPGNGESPDMFEGEFDLLIGRAP